MPTKAKTIQQGKRVLISVSDILTIDEMVTGCTITFRNGKIIKVFESIDEVKKLIEKSLW